MIKRPFILLVTFIFNVNLFAQLITSTPVYPTVNDSIVIYFDASLGDGGLANYTGTDVYAHTGVITDKSTTTSDWKYTIAGWTTNLDKAKLTKVDANLWKLNIGFVREYYGIPSSEKVIRLAFVFRNSNGSKTGRDVGGADIFYDLYEPGITAIFSKPIIDDSFGDPGRTPLFMETGDTLDIEGRAVVLGTQVASLALQYEGSDLIQVADSVLTYQLFGNTLNAGINEFLLIAVDTSGLADTSQLVIVQNPEVQHLPLPYGIKPGININSSTSATMALFAPYKEFIYLIGDFNDWMVDSAYFMNCHYVSEDSVVFWLEIDNLNPGTEYAYQYLIDGNIRVADPYTKKILDPWNDKYINSTYEIYPDLKDYPVNKTEQAVATFQTAEPVYGWLYPEWNKPEKQDLVIYELLIRDFLDRHDYQTLIDTLDYLENLGINAIELLPVSEFEGNSSWGYNPSFHLALDKYYGPADAFKAFVDECHGRGIAVIMDMVLNHAYGQNPLVRMYWNSALNRPAADNPWFNETSPNTSYSWGSDFNHESQHTKYYVDRVNRFWIDEYHVDGFRFDFTKGFTNKVGDGGAYDASRISILERMADKIWEADSTAYIILEHFADNTEEKVLADYGMMLWGNSNWNYAQSSMGYTDGSDFSWGFYKSRGWTNPHLVTYMESHDEERLMFKNLAYGNSAGSYNIQNINTALNRQKMVNAFFLTLPGPKMIWQFGELGFDISIDEDCRVCEKDPFWDESDDLYHHNLYKTIAALLKLRRENDVFTNPKTSPNMSFGGAGKRIIMTGSPNVVIIGNFGVTSLSIAPNFQHGGDWFDYFSGDSLDIVNTIDPITLEAGEFHIYTDRRLTTPEQGIINGIEFENREYPQKFTLYPNFPNPFNASTSFRYEVEKQSILQIRIFDLNGREIYSGHQFSKTPGRYSFHWDGRNNAGQIVHSGVYFLALQRGNERLVQKITLLK